MAGGRVRFDDKGRRIDAIPVLAQWQGGEPYTIFPRNVAVREPQWPPC
jgi:branched-chain amino acid transport system substrate-binding protein